MVITQSLFDETIKNSSHIDDISVEIPPSRAYCRQHVQGVKQVMTNLVYIQGASHF